MNKFAFLTKTKEKLKNYFSDKKSSFFIMIIIVLAVVILFVSSTFENSSNSKKVENESNFSVLEYSEKVENKLQNMIIKIDEIEFASVMVMVESTPKIEYLSETNESQETDEKGTSSSKSTTIVFEKDGSVYSPVVITTLMPKVTGVLIVVNDISASTKHSIINSISVVLNIDVSCISILQKN